MANWLYAVQGFALLHEGEAVPLLNGSHLSEFSSGPLADLEEMKLTVLLREVELVPDGAGFHPRSRLRIDRPEMEPLALMVHVSQEIAFVSP